MLAFNCRDISNLICCTLVSNSDITVLYVRLIKLHIYYIPCFSIGVILDIIPLIMGCGSTAVVPTTGTEI